MLGRTAGSGSIHPWAAVPPAAVCKPQGHTQTRWPFHTLQAKDVPLPCQTHQNAHSALSCTNPAAPHPYECCCCCCTSLLLQCLLLL